MNNIPDLLKHMVKYPLILPKPPSNASATVTATSGNVTHAVPSQVGLKRNAPKDDLDMGPSAKVKISRQEQAETYPVPKEWLKSAETVPLLSLIERYRHMKSDQFQFMEGTLLSTSSDTKSRNYLRHKAVQESIKALNIHRSFNKMAMEKFFEYLGRYDCFSVNEIIAVKKVLNMLDYNQYLEGEDLPNALDQPPLITLITKFENRKLRYKQSEYPAHSTSYRREASVLEAIENYDIYSSLNSETIEKFFACLTDYCAFRMCEIVAVKRHMYSLMHSIQQNNLKNVNMPFLELESLSNREGKEEEHSVTKTVTTKFKNLSLLCPICQQTVGEDGVWQHILRTHVEWERAVKHDITFGDTKFCTHCFQAGFSTVLDVMKHETRIHGTNTENSCTFCGCTCHDIFEYYRHVVRQHGVLFQCPKCSEEFCQKNDFKQHMIKLHKKKFSAGWWRFKENYFCPFCNARFLIREKTVNHLFNRYNALKSDSDINKQLYCFSCGKPFQTHEELRAHLQLSDTCHCKEPKLKADHRSFVCYTCKERFETQEALQFHQSPRANSVLMAPIPLARPRNFKSKVFSVTCDVIRLNRAELAHHPQALNSMLDSFETLHKPDQQEGQSNEVRIKTGDNNSFTSETKQHGKNRVVHSKDLIVPAGENAENKEAVKFKHRPRSDTRDRICESNETLPVVVDNEVLQADTPPMTINDRQGNTVIINNQSGGSNTIILGNCCSHDVNQPTTQHINQSSSLAPSLSIQEHYQSSLTSRSLDNENVSDEIVIKDEKEDELKSKTNMPIDKKRVYTETVFDIQTMVREQFKSLESGKIAETQNTHSAMDAKVKRQLKTNSEEEIREIVRQEFEKYLASMYRGSLPADVVNQEEKICTASPATKSNAVPTSEKNCQIIAPKGNMTAANPKSNIINSTQQTLANEKLSQPIRIQPNPRPATWKARGPQHDTVSIPPNLQLGNNRQPNTPMLNQQVPVTGQQNPLKTSVTDSERGKISEKSDIPPQMTGLFMSDKDSMQALYGIKSEPEECSFTKTETCKEQSESKLGSERDKPKNGSDIVKTAIRNSVSASRTKLVSERIRDIIESNDRLITDIKTEPLSPPLVYAGRDEDIAEKRGDQDFVQRNPAPPYPSSPMTVVASTGSVSSDRQNRNKHITELPTTTALSESNGQIHNKHITELESVIASIKEEVDTECNNESVGEMIDEMREADSGRIIAQTTTSHSILRAQLQNTSTNCKTVAVLLPTSDVGYIAGVVEPSLVVSNLLKKSGGPGCGTKSNRQRGRDNILQTNVSWPKIYVSLSGTSHASTGQNSLQPTYIPPLAQSSTASMGNERLFCQNATTTNQYLPNQSTIKTATTMAVAVATVEPLLTEANKKKEAESPSLSGMSTTVRPLTQASSTQSLGMIQAPPALQGPNILITSSSHSMSGPKIPKVSVNQALPRLSVPLLPSSQPIPIMPASQTFSRMPVVLGNPAIPSLSMPVVSGTQAISSLNIPIMSVNQAFSSLNTPTVNLSFSCQSSAKEPSTTTEQETIIKSEKLDSTLQNTNKESDYDGSKNENTTVRIVGSEVIVKEEKEDVSNNLTSKPQALEQSCKAAEGSKQSLSTAEVSQNQNAIVLNVQTGSTNQSVPTSQTMIGQNIPLLGLNQTLPVQTVQIQPANQIFPGQTVQILSPNQAFQCQTIPLWAGQVMPQQPILNFSASQAQALQGLNVASSAITTAAAISGQSTTAVASTTSTVVPTSLVTSTAGKAGAESCPLQLVGAVPAGMVFQGSGTNAQCLFVPGQTIPSAPKASVYQNTVRAELQKQRKIPIAPIKRDRSTVKDVLLKNRNILPKGNIEDLYKVFDAKSWVGQKVLENLQLNAKRAKDCSSKTNDENSESLSSDGEKALKCDTAGDNNTERNDTKSVNQTGSHPTELNSQPYSKPSDSVNQVISESGKKPASESAVTKNQTSSEEKQTISEKNQNTSEAENQTFSGSSGSKNETPNHPIVSNKQNVSACELETHAKLQEFLCSRNMQGTKSEPSASVVNPANQGVNVSTVSTVAETKPTPSSKNQGQIIIAPIGNTTASKTSSNIISTMKQSSANKKQQLPVKIQPSPQQTVGFPQNMVSFLPNNLQFGNNSQQTTVMLNQGVPMAVQQNPVIQTGFQQNIMGPVQNMVLQSGQIIPQQMVYQPIQVQQGSMVLPQYIMTGSGSQSNPVMVVQQPQVMNVNTQNQPQLILPGSQSNPVTSVGQQPATSQPAGEQMPSYLQPIKGNI